MSASRAKGTAAETAVVRSLQAGGFKHAERRALNGAKDRGDVTGIPGVVIEVKNEKRMRLAEWVDEAHKEASYGDLIGAVWHKRRGFVRPGDWYVTMDGETFMGLLREAGYGDDSS